jgi:hypothetical protein
LRDNIRDGIKELQQFMLNHPVKEEFHTLYFIDMIIVADIE